MSTPIATSALFIFSLSPFCLLICFSLHKLICFFWRGKVCLPVAEQCAIRKEKVHHQPSYITLTLTLTLTLTIRLTLVRPIMPMPWPIDHNNNWLQTLPSDHNITLTLSQGPWPHHTSPWPWLWPWHAILWPWPQSITLASLIRLDQLPSRTKPTGSTGTVTSR